MKPNFKFVISEFVDNPFTFGKVWRTMAVDRDDESKAVMCATAIDSMKVFHKKKRKLMRQLKRRIKNHYRYKY